MSGQSIIDGLEEALAYMEASAEKTSYNTHTGKLYAAPEHVDVKDICKQAAPPLGVTERAGLTAAERRLIKKEAEQLQLTVIRPGTVREHPFCASVTV